MTSEIDYTFKTKYVTHSRCLNCQQLGEKEYWFKKPCRNCPRCGSSLRHVPRGAKYKMPILEEIKRREKHRAQQKKWKESEKGKKYYAESKQRRTEKQKLWAKENPETVKKSLKKYKSKPEVKAIISEYGKKYHIATKDNPERKLQRIKAKKRYNLKMKQLTMIPVTIPGRY